MVPTVRLTFRMGRRTSTGSRRSSAVAAERQRASYVERLLEAVVLVDHLADGDLGPDLRPVEDRGEVEAARLPVIDRLLDVEAVRRGRSSRPSCGSPAAPCARGPPAAMKRKKFSTNSGLPVNFARSFGSCVAMPTGQVLRWQTRIMMQPMTTSGAVAKPNSSAPRSAAMTTSRPVFSWPSVCTMMRSRSLFITSTCCVSASPSSHGTPPCLMRGERRGAGAAVVAARSARRRRAPWPRPPRPCRRRPRRPA